MRQQTCKCDSEAGTQREQQLATVLRLARFGYFYWCFGNLYEAIVKVPERIANDPPESVLAVGSPLRYYLPAIPVVIATTFSAPSIGWRCREHRPLLGLATIFALTGLGITAYLVPTVNLKLFVAGSQVAQAERERLLRKWHRLNKLRVFATAAAFFIGGRILARISDNRRAFIRGAR